MKLCHCVILFSRLDSLNVALAVPPCVMPATAERSLYVVRSAGSAAESKRKSELVTDEAR